jgi:predicted ATPase
VDLGVVDVDTLVGRDREVAAVSRLLRALADDEVGIVTLTGLPGVGRSAVAAAAVARLGDIVTKVVVVPLRRADDPLTTVDAVLASLPGEGLSTSLPEAMWEAYDGAPVLLVLEDVDRVQGLATVVEELTTGYSAATVLCTAVRPTRVTGERVVRLAPLPLPDDGAPADHVAVVLFAGLASARGVEIDLDDARVRAEVARVCRQAGGLPATLELAAARLDAVPLSAMARTLGAHRGVDAAT